MIDIKFGTDGWRAIIDKEFTVDNVERISIAFANWLVNKYDNKNLSVVLGHDCRRNGELYAETCAKVLCSQGIRVLLGKGFVSTPMISLGIKQLHANAGIVITASHNPADYNGFKVKADFGGPALPEDITAIEKLIPESSKLKLKSIESYQKSELLEYPDLESMYVHHLEKNFDLNAIRNKLFFAYDAMYGAGQNVIRRLFPEDQLLHCELDTSFDGTPPEPLHKNLLELSRTVANDEGLDVGFATDGDADRIGMYDRNGNFVDSHHIILLLIHYYARYRKQKGKVVVSFTVSEKVKKLCAHYDLPIEVTQVGFKHITEFMINENVLIGGEESGGIAMIGHIPERDGIWTGLMLLEFMAKTGKTLNMLVEEIYHIVGEFAYERNDLHLTEEQKLSIIEKCNKNKFKSFGKYEVQKVETIDGFKFFFKDEATVMLRASGTEPVLRVYCEARTVQRVTDLLDATKKTILEE
ncbi:MAG: phosphoglucomutase/phosphomannomutase family protein [Bacteroidetes bacterium]|nr:phosphoglucomutase/phosphomannomutase family protein [Bacteroidota bacterium]